MAETTRTDTSRGHWISVRKLIASVLAAVSAAIVASFLGVAGTLVGTALVSLVATLGKDVYPNSIRQTGSLLTEQRRDPAQDSDQPAESERQGGSDEATDSHPSDGPRRSHSPRLFRGRGRRLSWKGGVAVAVAVFVVSIGVVTAIETVANALLAHLIGGSGQGGSTTVGRVFSGNSHHTGLQDAKPQRRERGHYGGEEDTTGGN
jgi:hypothetical protein